MTADLFEDEQGGRPLWLTTLADLALLLVGFFVFLEANKQIGPRDLAAAFRAGFTAQPQAMPVDLALVQGFAPGSAEFQPSPAALDWARAAANDPRTRLTVTGEVDGSPEDVDPATGSGPILAADRARAVAAWLVRSRVAAPGRSALATGSGQRRAVLTSGYDGGRQ